MKHPPFVRVGGTNRNGDSGLDGIKLPDGASAFPVHFGEGPSIGRAGGRLAFEEDGIAATDGSERHLHAEGEALSGGGQAEHLEVQTVAEDALHGIRDDGLRRGERALARGGVFAEVFDDGVVSPDVAARGDELGFVAVVPRDEADLAVTELCPSVEGVEHRAHSIEGHPDGLGRTVRAVIAGPQGGHEEKSGRVLAEPLVNGCGHRRARVHFKGSGGFKSHLQPLERARLEGFRPDAPPQRREVEDRGLGDGGSEQGVHVAGFEGFVESTHRIGILFPLAGVVGEMKGTTLVQEDVRVSFEPLRELRDGVGGFDRVICEAVPLRRHIKHLAGFLPDQPSGLEHLGIGESHHLEAIQTAIERHADVFLELLERRGGLGAEGPRLVVSFKVGVDVAVRNDGHHVAPEDDPIIGVERG